MRVEGIARPDIKPAFTERNVPVALATDENYLPYLKVTINSAIANSPGSNLDIIVLHAGIPEDAILDFTAGYAGAGHATVRFVDISDELVASGLSGYKQTARLPLSSCYRLLLPRILPAYGKVVYIDVDVAVCRDLGELYATDVGDNWFAAAKDVVYTTKPEYVSWAAKWGFAEWDGYVNTGVLIMNLERFRREPVFDRLKEIVFEASKWLCDQDALNFVCKGAIAPLDPRWNVQLGNYCLDQQIALTGEEMWVAHFTGGQKPWAFPARRYSHLWWRYVDKTDVSRLWVQAWGDAFVPTVGGTPKVSIIMPVYNSARYLSEAIASVLCRKDLPDLELICIDDGSTDDSAAILEFWHDRDSRLRVLRQKNQGLGVARNAGLDAAKGEYIYFLDADDCIAPGDVLSRAYEQAKRDNLDMLLAAASLIAEDGKMLQPFTNLNHDLVPKEPVFAPDALGAALFLCTPLWPSAKLYRRAFLEENKLKFPSLKRSEDFPMVGLALALSRRIGVMQMPVVDRRIGVETSLESTKDETPLIFFEAEQLLRDSLKERKLWSRFKAAVYTAFVSSLAYNLRAVRNYSSFRAIIAKYREEREQWICWKQVDMQARYANNLQLIKDIEEDMDDDDQIALFVKLKEAAAQHTMSLKAAVRKAQLAKIRITADKRKADNDALRERLDKVIAQSEKRKADNEVLRDRLAKAVAQSEKRRSDNETLRERLDKVIAQSDKRRADNEVLRNRLAKAVAQSEKRQADNELLR
ncbi:MAG: glycosyltransferase, partial [Kiritimatiellae bacterium]|nr:glycosyltransferase [Kiritimatiellia bacterium]